MLTSAYCPTQCVADGLEHVTCYCAGETDESHQELVQFCRDFPFQRMGAFTYSEEDGTPAAEYQDQVRLAHIVSGI